MTVADHPESLFEMATDCRLPGGSRIRVFAPNGRGVEVLCSHGWDHWISAVSLEFAHENLDYTDEWPNRLALKHDIDQVPRTASSIEEFDDAMAGDSDMPWILKTSVDYDGFEIFFFVPPGLRVFKGHFPGHPITPGVLLLNWIGCWIKSVLGEERPILSLTKLKFSRPVLPMAVIRSQVRRGGSSLRFSLSSMGGAHSSGIFHLGGVS